MDIIPCVLNEKIDGYIDDLYFMEHKERFYNTLDTLLILTKYITHAGNWKLRYNYNMKTYEIKSYEHLNREVCLTMSIPR